MGAQSIRSAFPGEPARVRGGRRAFVAAVGFTWRLSSRVLVCARRFALGRLLRNAGRLSLRILVARGFTERRVFRPAWDGERHRLPRREMRVQTRTVVVGEPDNIHSVLSQDSLIAASE
jgi:hypothetical protein